MVGSVDGSGGGLSAPGEVSMGASPRAWCGTSPKVEMQQDEASAEGTCALVQVTVGDHAYEWCEGTTLRLGGGHESGPPRGGVGVGYNGDTVGLVSTCFKK